MSLADEEDNDLYGSAPRKSPPCVACGGPTRMSQAKAFRIKSGLCADCFAFRERERLEVKGKEVWREEKTYVRRTPFDSGRE